jgi:hypothetical protein
MDTDYLSEMAYEVIIRADDILDVLKSEIGASAAGKKTEDDFLCGVVAHLRRILRSPKAYLDDWNCLEEIDVRTFRKDVAELLAYVEKVLSIPYSERGE